MSKLPKTPVDPDDCCKIPNCRTMLCGIINAYYERMTGCQVIETEVGEEKFKFASASISQMRTFAASLQETCGDEQTEVFIEGMKGQYGCHTPNPCIAQPRRRAGCHEC